MIKGYDLADEKEVENKEIVNGDDLKVQIDLYLMGMKNILLSKAREYDNSVMKGSFRTLYTDFLRKWVRIKVVFGKPLLRLIDILLGRTVSISIYDEDCVNELKHSKDLSSEYVEEFETFEEAFYDMACYCILMLIFMKKSYDESKIESYTENE